MPSNFFAGRGVEERDGKGLVGIAGKEEVGDRKERVVDKEGGKGRKRRGK